MMNDILLHEAYRRGEMAAVRALLGDYTPLHWAAAGGDLPLIQLLLEHGADPQLRTNIDDFETPIELAHARGNTEAARVMEAHFAR